MLYFIGMVVTAASMMVLADALITFVSLSRAARITLVAATGVWIGVAALVAEAAGGSGSSSSSHHSDLDYLKAVNSVAPPRDPELLFLLMAGYSNANLQGEGAEFFSARLKEFDSRLAAAQKALYLSAIGLLRAQNASSVSLLHRIGYVKDAISIFGTSQAAIRRAGFRR